MKQTSLTPAKSHLLCLKPYSCNWDFASLPHTMKQDFSTEEVKQALDVVMDSETNSDVLSVVSDSDTANEDLVSVSESSSANSMECSDAGDEETAACGEWISKSREIQWAPSNKETLHYLSVATTVTPGPTVYAVAHIGNLEDSFNLYLTDEIVQMIVDYTNLHGQRSVGKWTNTNPTEIRAYFGLLLLAGVYRSRNESTRSLWDEWTGRSVFRSTMPLKRFQLINAMIQFDDRLSRCCIKDKMAAFREVWEKWTARLPLLFNLSNDICVDEQWVPYRGDCSFRQYMPKKPGRYGLKIWVTADVGTSYAWRMSVYTGKEAEAPSEQNQGRCV